MSATSFSFEYAFIALTVAAAAVYAWAARNDRPSPRRAALYATGLFLIAASLNSPLETIAAKRLLLIHLLQNALIADVAPLLVLLGLTPAMRAWLDAHGARFIRARYALPAWLLAWYGTHIAGFYTWALDTGWALNIEHGILIAGGLALLVAARLRPPRRPRPRSRTSARVSSRRRSSASRSSSRAGPSTRSTRRRRGCGVSRRFATRISAAS